MAQHELMPAIVALERRVDEAEQKANSLLMALNVLRDEAGLPPRPPGTGAKDTTKAGTPTHIKTDSFFGKKQQTAVREFLEMRRAQGLGPAKPREIYDGLVAGGYQYQTKDVDTALVGLRAMLRKRSSVFIKVGNTGSYGLVAWYPDARKPSEAKPESAEDEVDFDLDADDMSDDMSEETETAASDDPSEAAVA